MPSPRDVIADLLRGKPSERMGLYDSPWGDTLQKWLKQGYPANAEGKPVDPIDHFGFDMAGCGGWFDSLPLRGVSETLEETDEWVVKRNGAGAALKTWKHKSGTPEHIDFRMTSREVWDRDYRPHLARLDPERVNVEAARKALQQRRAAGLWTFYGHLFIWEDMRRSMGDVCMFESLVLDPDWIRDYGRVMTDFYKAHYAYLFEQAGLPDGVWVYEDLGYRNGLFCSPRVLEELIFPYYAELVGFFHAYGLPVVLHACGGIEAALPLIVEAGFDALNPMQVSAGCDVVRFAERYADRLAFIGGLDARVIESGDRERIRREAGRIMGAMRSLGARYVFGSDHSISTNVDYDAFRCMMDVYHEMKHY